MEQVERDKYLAGVTNEGNVAANLLGSQTIGRRGVGCGVSFGGLQVC